MIDPPPQGYLFRDADNVLWTYLGQNWVMMQPQNCYTLGCHNGLVVIHNPDRGYAHLHPLPDSDDIEAYYSDDQFYTTHSPPDWLEKERREYQAGLWHSCFRYLYELVKELKERTDLFGGKYYMPPSILDWGCGAGWWLDWLYKNASRNHFGIEPSSMARAIRQAPYIYESPNDFIGRQFDVISLQLVLEHIAEPVGFLRSLDQWLTPGGKLLITVPNDFNPLQRRIGYYGFISKVHTNYFTPESLRHVLTEAGYRVCFQGATFPMELFVLMGWNYIGNDKLGRRCHRIRLRLERLFGWRIYKLYKRLYDRWGIGRELIVVAERL